MDDFLDFLKLLSDRTRLRIMLLISGSELCVCQLMEVLGMSQPRISGQLAILKRAKLIANRRVGKWIYYRISPVLKPDYIQPFLSLLRQSLRDDETVESDQAALQVFLDIQEKTGRCDVEACKDALKN